jgi:four helix bundle protein
MNPPDDLKERTKLFALRIVKLYRSLPKSQEALVLGKQILRSGTSIGANYRAASRARSRAEFVAKLGIVLEEADETEYWLELITETGIFPEARMQELREEAEELVSIFVASLRSAKGLPASA